MAGNGVAGTITILGEVKTKGFADAKAKLDLLVDVAGRLAKAFDDTFDRGGKYSDMLDRQSIAVEKAAEAAKGLISNYDLVQNANKMAARGLQLTEEQYASVTKAASLYAQTTGVSETEALQNLSGALIRGKGNMLAMYGLHVDGKSAAERQAQAVQQLTEKYAGLEVQTGGAADGWDKLKVAWKNVNDEMALSISRNLKLGEAFEGMALWLKTSAGSVEDLKNQLRDLNIEEAKSQERREREAREKGYGGLRGMGETPGVDTAAELTRRRIDLEGRLAKAEAERAAAKKKRDDEQAANWAKGGYGIGGENWWRAQLVRDKKTKTGGGGTLSSNLTEGLDDAAARGVYGSGIAMGMFPGMEPGGAESAVKKAIGASAIDAEIKADAQWADVIRRGNDGFAERLRLTGECGDAMDIYTQSVRNANAAAEEIAAPLAGLTAGLWGAADAALQSGESFGSVALKMLKDYLLSEAQRCTVNAIIATAQGFFALGRWDLQAAAANFTAAGIFAAGAAACGAAGVGISAASAPSRSGSGPSSQRDNAAPRQAFGSKREQDQKEVNVYVYLGDKYDRSAQLYMKKSVEAKAA